jgi:hypothetical protein
MNSRVPLRGVYAKTIQDLSHNGYGNLKYLYEFMEDKQHHEAKYRVLNFSPSFEVEPIYESTQRKASQDMVGKYRSLYIVEDLSWDVIEELGAAFDIEPQFLGEHLRAVQWEHHNDKSNAMTLPSVRHLARYWTIHYLEPIVMDKRYPSERARLQDTNVLRRIEFRTPHKDRRGGPKSVGLVHRIISFWHRPHTNGSFEGML